MQPQQQRYPGQRHEQSQWGGNMKQATVAQHERIEGQQADANQGRPTAQQLAREAVEQEQQNTGQGRRGGPAQSILLHLCLSQIDDRGGPGGHSYARIANTGGQMKITRRPGLGKFLGVLKEKRFIGGQKQIQLDQPRPENNQDE